jgi:hypothetical protein
VALCESVRWAATQEIGKTAPEKRRAVLTTDEDNVIKLVRDKQGRQCLQTGRKYGRSSIAKLCPRRRFAEGTRAS